MAKSKLKTKRNTFLSMLVTLGSFIYKAVLAILTLSMVLMVASLSTLMVFIAKLAFVRNYTKTRDKKKKAYLVMSIAVIMYSFIFIAFAVLKINGIDISNQNTYEPWLASLLIGFLIVMFVLSIIKLKSALEKSDITLIGLKEMIFISALADVVIIFEFITRTVLTYNDAPVMVIINSYVPLGVGVTMIVTSAIMLIRYLRYKA